MSKKKGRPEKKIPAASISHAIRSLAGASEKWLMARLAIYKGREVTTMTGINGDKETVAGFLTGRVYHWRVVSVNDHHFTAAFIAPRTKADGLRRSFIWADVVDGSVRPC